MRNKEKNFALSFVLLGVVAVFTVFITYILYLRTSNILEARLKDKLVSLVSTASLQFDPKDIENVNNKEDVNSKSYKDLTLALQDIRNANSNIYFSYLLRPTDDIYTYTFIADADSLNPDAEIDLNSDGIVDESDALAYPGLEYDVTDIPALQNAAKLYATTDDEPEVDDWGTLFSAYAPIKEKGVTIAVVGLDVEVSDYQKVISQTFIPFLSFVVFLFAILTLLTLTLVSLWGSRVKILNELDRQKDELLGLVSHQLATPISGLRWNLEMFADGDLGPLNEKQLAEMKTMQGVAANLSDLASMILDVSRVQLGRMKVDKTNIDMKAFFNEIFDVIEPKAKDKNINFKHEIPNSLNTGFIDKRLTHMTIENLISNAVKYTPNNGSVTVNISLQNEILNIEVKDTGIGIPKADQEKIFGKLFRASNVATVDGNGFGLYIAKGAIEAQGGGIRFESQEGKGTSFFVKLPIGEHKDTSQ